MDLDLAGKHALVCGGSEGIGRAAAHELALLGADVTVLSRRAEALQEVVAALPCSGSWAIFAQASLTSWWSIRSTD